jgi:endonuclease/exonuclease/phosphatase family metal-dependent hydrolase
MDRSWFSFQQETIFTSRVQRSYIRQSTWAPGRFLVPLKKLNQIDHLQVSARHASSIIDVRNSRGANCDSDHYLVKDEVTERISRGWKQELGMEG